MTEANVKSCANCAHYRRNNVVYDCGYAIEPTAAARDEFGICGEVGRMWLQAQPRKGLLTIIKDWLI